ncbi:DUF1465 family protein [Ancylobacter defluvii]|uniref:AraC family transcriptional regulator n=1 Tax=Ancylobacter defluvii TaxID=1282440 RepID=A0A9W6JTH4_9HYPH|nr:DUF1465 family protein [Ancylobacter defluvii]MBS7587497.1 DUF1465 family protein [Ancylobacter defluvii]GLK82188.1 AraC family transcriptional regulator [Ancylobacter defluvii]
MPLDGPACLDGPARLGGPARLDGPAPALPASASPPPALADDRLVSLAERRVASPAFAALFAEGIALIDESADYLDGPGRADAAALERRARAAYAEASRRLTTRLMNLTSWLLLQKAVAEGDMSAETARREADKVELGADAPAPETEDRLPAPLAALILRSLDLERRVRQLDAALRARRPAERPINAVAGQIGRLRSAFERP